MCIHIWQGYIKNECCSSHVGLFTGGNRTAVMSTMAGAFVRRPSADTAMGALGQPTGQQEQQPQKDERGRSEAMLTSLGPHTKEFVKCLFIDEQGPT